MKKLTVLTLTLLLTALAQLTAQLPPEQAELPQADSPIVQLVYFRSSDKPVRPNVDAEIDGFIKKAQRFYADEIERHGFDRKTFQFETDAHGNAVVHHVNGKFPYAHYQQTLSWDEEINEQVYIPRKSITVIMIDTGGEEKLPAGVCGHGGGSPHSGGGTDIYCWDWSVIAHELGHAFGMNYHDFRSESYLMSHGHKNKLSPCFAAWLDVHPAFNPTVVRRGTRATIQMLSATLAAPPNAIRLRFTVTAPAGSLYQARLLTPEKLTLDGYVVGSGGLIGCKRIDGNPTSRTVEFVTALTPDPKSVSLHIIGIDGDIVGGESFPIDVASLLPPAKVVSIPDPNLAAAVRESLNMSSGETVTTHSILNLVRLGPTNRGTKFLTGLEHAVNLRVLILDGTAVSDVSALASLTNLERLYLGWTGVSDVSALASLTNLEGLWLGRTDVSDVSALAGLTNLEWLFLSDTAVSDVSALASLTNLEWLSLNNTGVSDVSALAGLINLEWLSLNNTAVSDVSPLLGLSLPGVSRDSTVLRLGGCPLSYASIHTHIPALQAKGIEVAFDNVADVNGDGVVNVQDLVLIAGQFGKTGEHRADVNGDGVVNIQDLVLVAGAFEAGAAAPSVRAVSRARLTVSDVEGWLIEASRPGGLAYGEEASRPGGLSYGRGIAVLERLLASLMPTETVLLANYPNPFNPETWIPYQLSEPAEVTVTIYAANGAVVRMLDIGHRRAGSYESRHRAAYWDGRNAAGESVASGVYFYTLSAREFSATRKMVIRK